MDGKRVREIWSGGDQETDIESAIEYLEALKAEGAPKLVSIKVVIDIPEE